MARCPYCAAQNFAPVLYPEAKFNLCRDCGVVSKTLWEHDHATLATTVYTKISWGETKAASVAAHGPIIGGALKAVHDRQPFSPSQSYLDIGAGVGVLEHVFFEMLGTTAIDITPLEPVAEIAQLLREEYPHLNVVSADLEVFPKQHDKSFDVVFCLGVDYLFRDLDTSLAIISKLTRQRAIFSRNVFLDLDAYFGGKKIRTFGDLVGPNPLISMYMYPDQYLEMLRRHFTLNFDGIFIVEYSEKPRPDFGRTQFTLADCGPGVRREPNPVRNVARAVRRLAELGVGVA